MRRSTAFVASTGDTFPDRNSEPSSTAPQSASNFPLSPAFASDVGVDNDPIQAGGGYVDAAGGTKYESTFVGVVPAEAPALSVIVVIDEPAGGNYTGGAVAAPAFSKIAAFGLRQFSVPPPVTDIANGGVPVGPLSAGHTGATVLPNGKLRASTAGAAEAAQHGRDPRQELLDRERLGHVVVAAEG